MEIHRKILEYLWWEKQGKKFSWKTATSIKEKLENKQPHGHLDDYYVPNIRGDIVIQLSQIIGSLLFGNIRLKIDLFIFSSISKNSSVILLNIIIIYIFKYFWYYIIGR